MFSSISLVKKISLFLSIPFLFVLSIANAQEPSLVGTVEIQDNSGEEVKPPDIIVTPDKIPQKYVDTLEAETITPPTQDNESDIEDDEKNLKDKILAINALNDNTIKLPILKEDFQINVASSNSLQIINSPADLDIISTFFMNKENLWELGISPGIDTIKWEYSKDNTEWNIFESPDIAEVFDTNVAKWSLHNFYFRLHTPTKITSPGIYNTKVTIIVSEPEG